MPKRRLEDREVGATIDQLPGLIEHQRNALVEFDLDRPGRAVKLL
jgi:hypothetical protein